MIYEIQHRIETLAENAVMAKDKPAAFSSLGLDFQHWEFNYRDGWLQNYWLVSGKIKANNPSDAIQEFRARLRKTIPRVALIGQCRDRALREQGE
jgi:hypothetical protein